MPKIKSPSNWTKYLLPMHPIVYITTVSNSEVDNCAVYATCLDTSYKPPQITFASAVKQHKVIDSFSENKLESKVQDTLSNIKENKFFVVNVPGIETASAMKELSYPYSPDVDEIEKARLTKLNPFFINIHPSPKLIEECLAHIECELTSNGIYHAEQSDHVLVTGNVLGTSYDSQLGTEKNQIRKNLIGRVFGQLGVAPKKDCRWLGEINLYELENTLIFESEREDESHGISRA